MLLRMVSKYFRISNVCPKQSRTCSDSGHNLTQLSTKDKTLNKGTSKVSEDSERIYFIEKLGL